MRHGTRGTTAAQEGSVHSLEPLEVLELAYSLLIVLPLLVALCTGEEARCIRSFLLAFPRLAPQDAVIPSYDFLPGIRTQAHAQFVLVVHKECQFRSFLGSSSWIGIYLQRYGRPRKKHCHSSVWYPASGGTQEKSL